MKLIKVLFIIFFFALILVAAEQNLEVLTRTVTLGLDWPEALAFTLELPVYVPIVVIFLLGFGLVSLSSMREYLEQRLRLRKARKEIKALEAKLAPPPVQPDIQPDATEPPTDTAADIKDHLQTETERAMDTTTPAAKATETPTAQARPQPEEKPEEKPEAHKDEEILVPRPGPGWGTVLLLAAALALVLSGGVYIVLNEQLTELAVQMDDVTGLTGHLSSVQQEMSRTWEQERVLVRDDLGVLKESTDSLVEEVRALAGLPDEVRKRLVAGFLRDTASRAAYLVSQIESEAQRETLQGIQEQLQALALELEALIPGDIDDEEHR